MKRQTNERLICVKQMKRILFIRIRMPSSFILRDRTFLSLTFNGLKFGH